MNSFLFFQGFIYRTRIDVEDEIIDTLSEQISQEVDNEIIRTLRRTINGGDTLQDNVNYLNYWMDMGGQRA